MFMSQDILEVAFVIYLKYYAALLVSISVRLSHTQSLSSSMIDTVSSWDHLFLFYYNTSLSLSLSLSLSIYLSIFVYLSHSLSLSLSPSLSLSIYLSLSSSYPSYLLSLGEWAPKKISNPHYFSGERKKNHSKERNLDK